MLGFNRAVLGADLEDDVTNEEFIAYCKDREIEARIDGAAVVVTGGYVDLPRLTTLPKGTRFENDGYVYLPRLTTLPKGTRFENGGGVYLDSLTSPSQTYLGQTVTLRHIDDFTMLMGASRKIGEVTLHKARYFGGGPIEKLRECYIAEQDDTFAHGQTAKDAMRDLRFKFAQADYDASDLIAEIKERGTVRWEDFRLITGACSHGLRVGMEQADLDPEAEELPLNVVLAKVHGPFGDAFKEALA